MSRSGMVLKLGAAAALGYGVAYFSDSGQGRGRRARLRDQARSRLGRAEQGLERRARYERGRVDGVLHRLRPPGHGPAGDDDRTLSDRVRSQALGRMPELAHRITIDVSAGEVTLRGQLDDGVDILRVENEVKQVGGVQRVVNLLHLEGEAAPNKAEARHTGT